MGPSGASRQTGLPPSRPSGVWSHPTNDQQIFFSDDDVVDDLDHIRDHHIHRALPDNFDADCDDDNNDDGDDDAGDDAADDDDVDVDDQDRVRLYTLGTPQHQL